MPLFYMMPANWEKKPEIIIWIFNKVCPEQETLSEINRGIIYSDKKVNYRGR